MVKVELVTPERLLQQAEGDIILLPTVEGELGIRHGHIPLIVPLKPGEVVVKKDSGHEVSYAVTGGFAEIIDDVVTILADSAEHADEINEDQVQAAIARAKELKSQAKDEQAFADAAAHLEAELARLRVHQRRKARGRVTLSDTPESEGQ